MTLPPPKPNAFKCHVRPPADRPATPRPLTRASHSARVACTFLPSRGTPCQQPPAPPDPAQPFPPPLTLTFPLNPDIATHPAMTCGSGKPLVRGMIANVCAAHSMNRNSAFHAACGVPRSASTFPQVTALPACDSDIRDNALTCNDAPTGTRFGSEKAQHSCPHNLQTPQHVYSLSFSYACVSHPIESDIRDLKSKRAGQPSF